MIALPILLSCALQDDAVQADPPRRPNVVVILTDDQGYGDLSLHGNPVLHTPNIDSLARDGASLTRFYVSPVCAPTRASLLTGRWNYRTGVVDTYVGRAMMRPDEVTLADLLREHGWATGIFGKWHLGDCAPLRPNDQGFDEALVHRGGGIGQPSDPPGGERRYTDPVLFHNGEQVQAKGYCTDVYFDAAIAWLRERHAAGQPFFCYLPTNAPHGPFHDVPAEDYRHFREQDLSPGAFPQDGAPLPKQHDEDRLARIYAMIRNIDRNVGRLLAALDELGCARDTLVVFLCDNGPEGRRYVAGLRGSKGTVWEGGIRSPSFWRWPARIPAGRTDERIAAHVDLLPTALEACGVTLPGALAVDGRSLLTLLEGRDIVWPERSLFLQWHRGDVPQRFHACAVVTQRWKLVHPSPPGQEALGTPPRWQLYDLPADPFEQHDLAAAHGDLVARLAGEYGAWFDSVSAGHAAGWPPPRIAVGSAAERVTVLTRQDWRRESADGGWGRRSQGVWLLDVREGRYAVRVRFAAAAAGERVVLEARGERWVATPPEGATACAFEIGLPGGPADLRVTAGVGERLRGALQVEIEPVR